MTPIKIIREEIYNRFPNVKDCKIDGWGKKLMIVKKRKLPREKLKIISTVEWRLGAEANLQRIKQSETDAQYTKQIRKL